MRSSFFGFAAVAAAAGLAIAADSKPQQAGAPVLGYAFGEQTRELRAILGVPGSSTWSAAMTLPEGVTNVRIANGHRWALTSSGDGAGVLVLETLAHTRLEASWDAAIFSPSGSAVALQKGTSWSVYTGMPGSPALEGTFEMAAAESLALSDSGELAGVREGRIVRASTGDAIANCDSCVIAYFPGVSTLAAYEPATQRLLEVSEQNRVIAEGVAMPQLQRIATATNRVALAAKDKLLVFDRGNGAIAGEEALAEGTDRLEAMQLPGAWLLSAGDGDTICWMVTPDGIRFVSNNKEQR